MADEVLTARDLGRMSRAAVARKDRDGWLALWAPDGVVQDPVGPSPFNPDGQGHRGRDAIAAFYDTVIAPAEKIEFEITQSYLCGDEVADVGIIRTTLAGGKHMGVVRLVQIYRTNGAGQLASLRAFWEFDNLELVELTEESN